jgi:hypothetical protein
MTKLTYFTLADDLIEPLAAASITLTGAIAGYPGSNIRTTEMGETARSSVPVAGGKLQITFGAGVAPRLWALLNTNVTAGDVALKSYSTAFDTSGGPTLLQSWTIPFRLLDMKSYLTGAITAARYWEIDVNGCSFADAFFEIGKVMCGVSIQTFTNDYSDFQSGVAYRNLYNETQGGVCYAHMLEKRRRNLELSWNASLVADALPDILEMLEDTRGGAYPLIIIPDNDAADLYYVRASDSASWKEQSARSYLTGLTLGFGELSRGRIQVEA